ncbi:MAG: diguanylate cyclase [Candidatus Omnitrophica bacterium]|nr:diguanylate cyclase [Candidatus Omnitrophota bacterium]
MTKKKANYSLRRKLNIAFALMSILPLLVTGYLVSNYILPNIGINLNISVTVGVSIFIAISGFFVVKEIFDRITSISGEAKLIAAGDVSRTLEVEQQDEVGLLGESLNLLTTRIRNNMDELKNYSEKTTEINLEIQKRVIVLSSLLQISSLIAQSAKLDDILKLAVEKSRLLASSEIAFLLYREEDKETFYMKAADGINADALSKITVGPTEDYFEELVDFNKPLLIDKANGLSTEAQSAFVDKFRMKNALTSSVFLRGRVRAVLGIGSNKSGFSYGKDDSELVDVFAKQIAIAIENDILMNRVEKLEIKDTLTGLYNEAFMQSRLQEEIRRGITYQRPCSLIIFDIDNFKRYHQYRGSLQVESTLKKIASLIQDSVSDIDRVGRMGDDEFAILMPERNKRKAQDLAEEIRKKVEFAFSEESDLNKRITVSVGVSENPLDGIDAQELISIAKELVALAKSRGKNCVVAFKDEKK